MNQPNFFIIGAPKCGTTALCQYLSDHPSVFVSEPKEPHYFSEDFPKMRAVDTLEDYLGLFNDVGSNKELIGEGSVWNLYSEVAVKNIYEFNPEAKIIVMLRNPVDLVYSMHSQHLITLDEDEEDFALAWNLQEKRRSGKNLPKRCREPKLLMYGEFGKLGYQVGRLLEVFPRDQVMFILFDYFAKDTKKAYEDVLEFIGVESDGRAEFPRINENKKHKNKLVARITQAPPKIILKPVLKLKKLLGINKLGLLEAARKANRSVAPRKEMNDKLRAEIVEHFREDVKSLADLIGANLEHWK